MKTLNRVRGKSGEDLTVDFLGEKGYRILERNYRFDRGEIDIIAEDHGTIVFVEVKARHTESFGDPADAVSDGKCAQVRKTAEGYLYQRNIDDRACRFDIVAIAFRHETPVITHLEDAF